MKSPVTTVAYQKFIFIRSGLTFLTPLAVVARPLKSLHHLNVQRWNAAFGVKFSCTFFTFQHIVIIIAIKKNFLQKKFFYEFYI